MRATSNQRTFQRGYDLERKAATVTQNGLEGTFFSRISKVVVQVDKRGTSEDSCKNYYRHRIKDEHRLESERKAVQV